MKKMNKKMGYSLLLPLFFVGMHVQFASAQTQAISDPMPATPVTSNETIDLPPVTLPSSTVSHVPAVPSVTPVTSPTPTTSSNVQVTDVSRQSNVATGNQKEVWAIKPASQPVTPTNSQATRLHMDSYQGPQVTTLHSEVPYVSGGIGTSEREDMTKQRKDFNLRLLFAAKGSGAYLSDVTVTIKDSKGNTVLNVPSDGPWFYVKLKPGNYKLSVETQNAAQHKDVSIPASGARDYSFYWDSH